MNLPNALTVLRIVLIPVFAWLYFHEARCAALAVYAVAALTDALDGYLARRLNQVTAFGKLCDPLADKLMQLTMLFCLAWTGYVPVWLLAALFLREMYQALGALYMLKRRHVVVSASMTGKVTTCLFIAGILLVYPWHEWAYVSAVGYWMLCAAMGCAVISAVLYTIKALGPRGADC